MSYNYRSHGDEDSWRERLSGAPSPYTPGSETFLFSSPPTSPPLHGPYGNTQTGYTSAFPNPTKGGGHRQISSISSIESEGSTRIGHSNSSEPKGTYRRTLSNLSKNSEMLKLWSTGIHWYVPAGMIFVYMIGIGAALAHHFFNQSLHYKPATNQVWMSRIGTALAFLTKASLVGAIVLAYRQRVWYTVRQKAITLRDLDGLFSVIEDPSWFILGFGMMKKAKVASLMALCTWLIPIASVMSPGSLTTRLQQVEYPELGNCTVSTVNFTREADSDWRHPRQKRQGYNLMFYETTPPPPALSIADWYSAPSEQSRRLIQLSFLSQSVTPEPESPCKGFNCTYIMEFYAPWYNCTELKNFSDTGFDINTFVPFASEDDGAEPDLNKNVIYRADTEDETTHFIKPHPDLRSPVYTSQGMFKKDPDIILGWTYDTKERLPNVVGTERWLNKMVHNAWRCEHQKAKYTVNSTWVDNRLASRKAVISEGKRTLEKGKEIGPKTEQGVEAYKEFMGYYAIGSLFREIVTGNLTASNRTKIVTTKSKLSVNPKLIDQTIHFPQKDFIHQFQKFYEDLVMSLISEPYLEIADKTTVPCLRTRFENRFWYTPKNLWIGYGISIFVSGLSILIGSLALYLNGFCSDITFSKILVTTRNATLDKLILSYPGVALGGDPMPTRLMETKLRFGILDQGTEDAEEGRPLLGALPRTAFGIDEEIKGITKEDVVRAIEAQDRAMMELESGGFLSGAGLGQLPG